jgi:hypothetical protein
VQAKANRNGIEEILVLELKMPNIK